MLRITVEHHLHGNHARREAVLQAEIYDDGTGSAERPNYRYKATLWRGHQLMTVRQGQLRNMPANELQEAPALVAKMLRDAFPLMPKLMYSTLHLERFPLDHP